MPRACSMLLVERKECIETKQMKTTYSTCCGTALVIFSDMKVPIENLMSREDDGFKQVMHNFNHVRWMLTNNLVGQGRPALADTFMYASSTRCRIIACRSSEAAVLPARAWGAKVESFKNLMKQELEEVARACLSHLPATSGDYFTGKGLKKSMGTEPGALHERSFMQWLRQAMLKSGLRGETSG